MRDFFSKKKDEADSQSRVSDDIVRQVFGRKDNQSLKETLYAAIRLKEERIRAKQNSVFPLIDKATLLQIIDEVQITYTGKGVTNMPKATLIDLFNRKLTVKIEQICECIQAILSAPGVGYLREITTMSKMVVLQLNRLQYHQMRDFAHNMPL